MVDVNQSERDALVVRGYLAEEERGNGTALKKAIEAVLSDIELDLQFETAERSPATRAGRVRAATRTAIPSK
jgi:hypothetical protein